MTTRRRRRARKGVAKRWVEGGMLCLPLPAPLTHPSLLSITLPCALPLPSLSRPSPSLSPTAPQEAAALAAAKAEAFLDRCDTGPTPSFPTSLFPYVTSPCFHFSTGATQAPHSQPHAPHLTSIPLASPIHYSLFSYVYSPCFPPSPAPPCPRVPAHFPLPPLPPPPSEDVKQDAEATRLAAEQSYLRAAHDFAATVAAAVAPAAALAKSKTVTDVVEAVRFFVRAVNFNVRGSRRALQVRRSPIYICTHPLTRHSPRPADLLRVGFSPGEGDPRRLPGRVQTRVSHGRRRRCCRWAPLVDPSHRHMNPL